MKFVEKLNREVMDVELPGIFVNNCMTSLDELSLKLYIYIKFLAKNNMEFARADIAKKLGVKVAEGTPCACAAFANFSMSKTVKAGFAIVSPNTALVLGRNAARSSSMVQSGERKVNSIPIFFMVTAKRL